MRELLKYGLAVAVYIAISLYTKRLLTWTNGPLYFLTTLEISPLAFRQFRQSVADR